MRHSLPLLIVVLALGCASGSSRPETVAQPEIEAHLVNPIFFGSRAVGAANIDVRIANRANVPIVVRRIEVDSPAMAQYTIRQVTREYRRTLDAGESETFAIAATAVTNTNSPTEPLAIRAIVEIEAEGQRWREIIWGRE